MPYIFVFDASACTGCKACQVACKDKNQLPLGVLWRRVYEVTGGTWQQQGAAWTNTIFGSNLSLACNHCVHPKCAGVCPVDAYTVRPDGIVYINTTRCTGCGYCAWACPYDAPQPDEKQGVYSKCDLCRDYLDQGLPPACVSACPMRCLSMVEEKEEEPLPGGIPLWKVPGEEHPFPLPGFSRTEPHLLLHPHQSSLRTGEPAAVSNREEVSPAAVHSDARREFPLVVFTLLTQAAAGIMGAAFAFGLLLNTWQVIKESLLAPLVVSLSATLLGILFAFLHLGKPLNAWRMPGHLKKSWLSRELLVVSLFSGMNLFLVGLLLFPGNPGISWLSAAGSTCLLGFILVWFEHSVYRLRSVAGWHTWRTLGEFFVTTLTLGSLGSGLLIPGNLLTLVLPGLILTAVLGLAISLALVFTRKQQVSKPVFPGQVSLVLAALFFLSMLSFLPSIPARIGLGMAFLASLSGEIIGRMEFYSRRKPGI